MSLGRGIAGILVVIAIAYLFSYDRKRIDWKLVGGGLLIQLVLALSILYIPIVGSLFKSLGIVFVKLMDFTSAGLNFLLGPYASKSAGFSFLLHSLPIVVFLLGFGLYLLLLGNYSESSRRVVVAAAESDEYIRNRRFGCVWKYLFRDD